MIFEVWARQIFCGTLIVYAFKDYPSRHVFKDPGKFWDIQAFDYVPKIKRYKQLKLVRIK